MARFSGKVAIVTDITTSKGQDLIISSTLKKFGQINILINNAGANLPDASGNTRSNCAIENLQKMLQLNLQSVVEMTQKTRPHLAKTRGEIVNISSIGAAARGLSAEDSLKFYNSMGEIPHCIPAGYCGQPEHLASVIAFLADRKASEYIVGQTIIADGGTSLVLGMHSVFGVKK
ncbi:Protein CBG05821 [Caenorhabditis briggsae]|uniref:Protein CBG05821 n=1 Tax=Caenorhabditis briggsae TaxID=6238 RepID=A8X1J7_CAEBR|nr:Protein CBG05821 [Caenorhabditis briggsae]CAP26507.2 Protein CBG05821 [Caenorhabditis briggsae]